MKLGLRKLKQYVTYFQVINVSASSIRLSKFGHSSGGIVMYIKDNLKKNISKRVHITNFGIFLVCDKSMLGLQRDFLLAGGYIPPENAKVYELYDDNNGINLLEDVLMMLLHEFKNLLIVLTKTC